MHRFVKVLLILAMAVSLGFFAGIYNTEPTVRVHDKAGQAIDTVLPSAGSVFLPGIKFESIPWSISRSSAIAAYLLLFSLITWGLGMAIGFTYRLVDPARAWQIHQDMSLSFGVLVIVHAFSLLFDKFIAFGLLDILLPFYSRFNSLYLSLGIIGFYILLIVIATSLFLRLKMPRLWRNIHYSVYLLFVLATIHGLQIGTDSSTLIMKMIYGLAGTIVALLFIYRFTFTLYKNKI